MSIICFQRSYEIIDCTQQIHKYSWVKRGLPQLNISYVMDSSQLAATANTLCVQWTVAEVKKSTGKLCCNSTWTIQAHATNVQPKVHQKYMWIGIVSKYCNFSFPATATTLHCVQLNCTHCEEYTRSRCDLKSRLCNILDKLQTDEYVYGAGMKFGKRGLKTLSWKLLKALPNKLFALPRCCFPPEYSANFAFASSCNYACSLREMK